MANPLEEKERQMDVHHELFCLFVIFQEIHQSHIQAEHATRKSIFWATQMYLSVNSASSSNNEVEVRLWHKKNTNIKVKEKVKKRSSRVGGREALKRPRLCFYFPGVVRTKAFRAFSLSVRSSFIRQSKLLTGQKGKKKGKKWKTTGLNKSSHGLLRLLPKGLSWAAPVRLFIMLAVGVE